MLMLSATIPMGRTTVAAEKHSMATAENALVTTMSEYLFFPYFPLLSPKNVEVNKHALSFLFNFI